MGTASLVCAHTLVFLRYGGALCKESDPDLHSTPRALPLLLLWGEEGPISRTERQISVVGTGGERSANRGEWRGTQGDGKE